MYLESVHLKGFQSHKDTKVDFVPGINLLIGPTNSGKTAVLRGLQWILKNRPLGEAFIHRGAKTASVESVWSNGENKTVVTRKRDKSESENSYTITGYEEPLTSFGVNPPPEVLDAINLSDTNVQSQFSPYFLVFDSPGVVAEYFRSITGLVEIDAVADNLSSKVGRNSTAVKEKEIALVEKKADIDVLAKIPLKEFERILVRVESLTATIQERQKCCKDLDQLCCQIRDLESQQSNIPEDLVKKIEQESKTVAVRYLADLQKQLSLRSIVSTWEELQAQKLELPAEAVQKINQKVQGASTKYASYMSLHSQLVLLVRDWKSLKAEKKDIPADTSESVEAALEKHDRLCQQMLSLYEWIEEVQKDTSDLEGIRKQLTAAKEEEKELMSQLDVCSHCGSELTEKTRQTLLENC